METVASTTVMKLIKPKLARAKGRITSSDAAAWTGLPFESVKDALDELMNTYVCRLQVTESGEILYDFGGSLRRRGSKTLRERLRDVGDVVWKLFTVGFKIWITVMLVVYFIIFLIILLALILGGRDSKKSIKLGWIGDLFADIFIIRSRSMAVVYALDSDGYRHRSMRQTTRRDQEVLEPKKRLVQSVYDFVFGPPRPNYDPFADEKEVAAWLRRERGVLTLTELVALAGWTYDEASERMADYLTRFKGDADITEDGVLIGKFDKLLHAGDSQADGGRVELFWDEYEAPFELSGNTAGRNAAIVGMNAFNLIFSLVMFSSPGAGVLLVENTGILLPAGIVQFALGAVPLLFSVIFFGVPLLRLPSVRKNEKQRKLRNLRRRMLRALFDANGMPLTQSQLLERINAAGGSPATLSQIEPQLLRLLSDYSGRSELTEDGTILYIFDRIGHETVVAARERNSRTKGEIGAVVFDTRA